ncbi:MAG: DUF4443 domain-containing protein [Promethearchaeota archaeon]
MSEIKKLYDLPKILKSATLQPNFSITHVIAALIIFGDEKYKNGIGRYRLQKHLQLTEGRIKSIIQRMKNFNLIKKENRISGHIITDKGRDLLNQLFEKLYPPKELKSDFKDLTIGDYAYFTIVYNVANKVSNGLDQRDAAKLIGGLGATCLIYQNGYFVFPDSKNKIKINFQELNNIKINNGDVLIIGTAEDKYTAKLATIAASLTLIDFQK